MATRALKLLIAGDATGALKALGSTGDASDSLGSKLASMGKKAALGLGAAGAATAVFLKGAVEAAAESEKIAKITDQVIKSTAGAAKISAEEVGKLATALSNKTGIDDEAIQSAQNLILTFKNVRNEVGKGNDIFNRASALALDMSAALGTDAKGSAMQLAKALDNPLKGITALTRSGVSFTAQQKEQIKTLMESGKTLEAQKIILKEVESQVGGAAAAQATAADRAKVAFGNLQEQIGDYFLPVVEKVSLFLTNSFIPKLAELADRYGPTVGAAFQRLGEAITPVFEWLKINVPIIVEQVGVRIAGFLNDVTGFWNKHREDILRIVGIYWEYIKTTVDNGIRMVKGVIDIFLGVLKGDWERVWNGLKDFVGGALNQIGNIIRTLGALLWEAAKYAFDKIKDGFIASWKMTGEWLAGLPDRIRGWLKGAGSWLLEAGKDVVAGFFRGIQDGWKTFFLGGSGKDSSLAKKLEAKTREELRSKSPSMAFYDIGTDVVAGLALGIDTATPRAVDAVTRMGAASIAVTGSWAGEAARNGAVLIKDTFMSMAGEMARNGQAIYKPLVSAMAGEAARNGNSVAKPLFASMAGEAARNGANQIAGALRTHLEVQARTLGYDIGQAMSEEITGSLEDVISQMSKRISGGIGAPGAGGGGGATGVVVGGGTPSAGGGGGVAPNVGDLYGRFGGTYGSWAKNQLGELANWNEKWNPAGSPQVRVFAPDPVKGGTLLDANGNPVYLDDTNAVRDALSNLVPQMAAGGIVTGPTLAMIGEAGPEAVVPLSSGAGYGNVTVNVSGSVIAERDLVDSIRKALIVEQQRGKILVP